MQVYVRRVRVNVLQNHCTIYTAKKTMEKAMTSLLRRQKEQRAESDSLFAAKTKGLGHIVRGYAVNTHCTYITVTFPYKKLSTKPAGTISLPLLIRKWYSYLYVLML